MASRDLFGDTTGLPVGQDFDLARPVESFVETVRAVVLQPVAFFGRLPRQGNFVSPLVFALVCGEIAALISGILGLAGGRGVGALITDLVGTLIGGTIGLFIIAAIAHLLVILIVGSTNSGFEATFRAAAYSTVTGLVSWIPVIGALAGLYGLYLAIVGIREMHQTTTGKAVAVVLIPVAIVVVIGFIVVALFAAAMIAAAMH
jgi:hypothetical protein